MARTFAAILALAAAPAWAQQPPAPAPQPPMVANPPIRWVSPEQKAEMAADLARLKAEAEKRKEDEERLKAEREKQREEQFLLASGRYSRASGKTPAAYATMEEKEAACVADARLRTSPPAVAKIIIVSGDTSWGRRIVRLSWDPRDAAPAEASAFECFFENDRLTISGSPLPLIAQ